MKQYLLDKIVAVKPTDRYFDRTKYNYSDQLKYSWKTWFGNEKYSIKLWLSNFWAERINPRLLAEDQKITKNDDSSIVFECTVNSLNEIAGWIVSRGEGIKVIEPKELKEKVIELANGVMKNYQN